MQNEPAPINPATVTWKVFRLVVAILLVLGLCFIILPTDCFGPQKHLADRARCLSNMKQLSLATMLYLGDFDEALPPHYSFDSVSEQKAYILSMSAYERIPETYLCVGDQKSSENQEGIPGKMDYVHLLSLRGIIPKFSSGKRVLTMSDVEDRSKAGYLRDPIRGYGGANDSGPSGFLSTHGAGFVTGFLDGHAKYVRRVDVNKDL